MLPPKIGDGVFGSSSGGVKPTGASFVAVVSAFSSVASALMVRGAMMLFGDLKLGSVRNGGCFRNTAAMRSPDFGVRRVDGVKREAWVAIAIENREIGG